LGTSFLLTVHHSMTVEPSSGMMWCK
jgi:hypothetical protein